MNRTFKKLSRCNSTSTIAGTTKYNTPCTSYRNDYVKPGFSNMSKYQLAQPTQIGLYRRPITQEQKMLCPECYNKNLINDHELKSSYMKNKPDLATSTTFEDNLRYANQKRIQDRINKRESMAKNAYSSISKYKNNKKEKLQLECENDNFFGTSKDYNRERAKKRQLQTEIFIKQNRSQFTQNENPEVLRYYEKCVGKGNEGIIKPSSKNYIDKENYYNDVKDQMEQNQRLKSQRMKKEKEEENALMQSQIEKQNQLYKQQYLKNMNAQRKMCEANQKMMNEKYEKEKLERMKKIKEEDEILQKAAKDNEQQKKEMQRKKEEFHKVCNDNLQRFLSDQEKKKRELTMEKEQDRQYKGFCPHGCDMMTCDLCHRLYPRRVMTPFIVRKRNNMKY